MIALNEYSMIPPPPRRAAVEATSSCRIKSLRVRCCFFHADWLWQQTNGEGCRYGASLRNVFAQWSDTRECSLRSWSAVNDKEKQDVCRTPPSATTTLAQRGNTNQIAVTYCAVSEKGCSQYRQRAFSEGHRETNRMTEWIRGLRHRVRLVLSHRRLLGVSVAGSTLRHTCPI